MARMTQIICLKCGAISDRSKRVMQGSFWMECFLWLLFILPGLIYSIWRLTTKAQACPTCGSSEIVPLSSPKGQQLLRDFAASEAAGEGGGGDLSESKLVLPMRAAVDRTSVFLKVCLVILMLGLAVLFSQIGQKKSAPAPNSFAALDAWWKQFTTVAEPTKAGTVTPAHTFTYKGQSRYVPSHVQTKAEEAKEVADAKWAKELRDLVQGFAVRDKTVTVLTNLTHQPVTNPHVEELCHALGGFVWAGDNLKYGLENIEVVGRDGVLLARRQGLRGPIQLY